MLRIKEAREARGFTQEQLARAIGTTQQTLQRWECGQVDPKITHIMEISNVLGITVSFICGMDGADDARAVLSDDEWAVVDAYRASNARGREQIRVFANGCAATYPLNQADLVSA